MTDAIGSKVLDDFRRFGDYQVEVSRFYGLRNGMASMTSAVAQAERPRHSSEQDGKEPIRAMTLAKNWCLTSIDAVPE
jgi:hypothetical protein